MNASKIKPKKVAQTNRKRGHPLKSIESDIENAKKLEYQKQLVVKHNDIEKDIDREVRVGKIGFEKLLEMYK